MNVSPAVGAQFGAGVCAASECGDHRTPHESSRHDSNHEERQGQQVHRKSTKIF